MLSRVLLPYQLEHTSASVEGRITYGKPALSADRFLGSLLQTNGIIFALYFTGRELSSQVVPWNFLDCYHDSDSILASRIHSPRSWLFLIPVYLRYGPFNVIPTETGVHAVSTFCSLPISSLKKNDQYWPSRRRCTFGIEADTLINFGKKNVSSRTTINVAASFNAKELFSLSFLSKPLLFLNICNAFWGYLWL